MLVLSRKESQRIRLGDSIVITIVKISGDKVRIGIDAPGRRACPSRRAGAARAAVRLFARQCRSPRGRAAPLRHSA